MIRTLQIDVSGQGLHDITGQVVVSVVDACFEESLCTLYIQHTSVSLLLQESYDPLARKDLENGLNRLVPEHDPLYTHTGAGR